MKNRQSAASNLSNEQYQVLLTGKFGDGCFHKNRGLNANFIYTTNSINKEIIDFKISLLGDLASKSGIREYINRGFKQNIIYIGNSITSPLITNLYNEDWKESLENMDELGLALWFYDDGSLHKNKLFYNLNTQKYSKEDNEYIAEVLKRKWDIIAMPTIERKLDGREFWYLRIRKFEGAFKISEILSKYYLNCYSYKIISSETIQKWSKLQEELKSTGKDIKDFHPRTLTTMMSKISL